jgi:hypothetical protein
MRQEDRRVSPSLTNELLRQMPKIRDAREHLLVCVVARVPTRLKCSRSKTQFVATQDFLAAIAQTRPTLAREMVEAFEEDRRRFARD